jgi:chromosome segregation ATPase
MQEYCPSLRDALEEEVDSLRAEVEFLKQECDNMSAHAQWCESGYVKIKIENNRLHAENEELSARAEAAAVAGDSLWKERCAELEQEHELLRNMVCLDCDECVDYRTMLDTAHERYNPDD